MATSPVEICNQALGWLGGDLIISLDDPTVEAKLCKANYAPLRDTVLEERAWTFAVERIELAALVDLPVYGYDKAFQLPPNVLRVLQCSRGEDNDNAGGSPMASSRGNTGQGRESKIPWTVEGDTVLASGANRVFARVLKRVVDTTRFSAAFSQALAARIAMDISIPLTNDISKQTAMAQMYGEKLYLAAATDGMQGRSERIRADSLKVVR